jgi:hypothetical protein
MLRVILKTQFKDQNNGAERSHIWTLDIHNEELESSLKAGGFSESGYEFTDIVGVEVIENKKETR